VSHGSHFIGALFALSGVSILFLPADHRLWWWGFVLVLMAVAYLAVAIRELLFVSPRRSR
jgi:hypothetical protein